MKKLDTYLDLCTQVYDLSKPNPPEDVYAFYHQYVSECQGAILEPMCGTGRFLLPLLESGFNISGFDASDQMLTALHNKAITRKLKPKVWQGFVEELREAKKYSLIFIPSGSFGLLIPMEVAIAALKTFYQHLSEDGILLFEVETLRAAPKQSGIYQCSRWKREDDKSILLSTFDLPLEDYVVTTICKYELIDKQRIIQTEIEEIKVRLYEPTLMIELLKEIGFKDVRPLKAFDRTSPPGDDELIVYECKK